jgi:hypothetical protein
MGSPQLKYGTSACIYGVSTGVFEMPENPDPSKPVMTPTIVNVPADTYWFKGTV